MWGGGGSASSRARRQMRGPPWQLGARRRARAGSPPTALRNHVLPPSGLCASPERECVRVRVHPSGPSCCSRLAQCSTQGRGSCEWGGAASAPHGAPLPSCFCACAAPASSEAVVWRGAARGGVGCGPCASGRACGAAQGSRAPPAPRASGAAVAAPCSSPPMHMRGRSTRLHFICTLYHRVTLPGLYHAMSQTPHHCRRRPMAKTQAI